VGSLVGGILLFVVHAGADPPRTNPTKEMPSTEAGVKNNAQNGPMKGPKAVTKSHSKKPRGTSARQKDMTGSDKMIDAEQGPGGKKAGP
jgi:hypothetical protein